MGDEKECNSQKGMGGLEIGKSRKRDEKNEKPRA